MRSEKGNPSGQPSSGDFRLTRRTWLVSAGSALALSPHTGSAARVGKIDISALMAKMTIQEKAGQLSIFHDFSRPLVGTGPGQAGEVNPVLQARSTEQIAERIRAGSMTGLFNGVGVEAGRKLQRIAVRESRLGIPLIFAGDVIHGLRTIFPVPLAEAAAFDADLAERTARMSAIEASAAGIHWTFAPMVDVGRDQRWGRVVEGSGEDVYLGEVLARARVRGFQGPDLRHPTSVLACPKHFAGYGAGAGGVDYATAELSEATLREVHLAPFKAAFEAGALTTMSAFNDVSGIPATAHGGLLTGILRDEWGFPGIVIADYAADKELIDHGVAEDPKDAARLAILAGVDISMESDLYNKHLPELVASGAVPMSVVDRSVRRVLELKQAIGLFDNPYRSLNPVRERTMIHTKAAHQLAREAGRRSIVLLKNDGNLLPLPKSDKRISLIGPFGADRANTNGTWSPFADRDGVSVASALRAAMPNPSNLTVVAGSGIEEALPNGIAEAVAAARAADVVVLAIGESQGMSGEAQSRSEITVPKHQQALAEAIVATGKPMVVLLRNGRALALEGAVRNAPAILVTWFLGSEMGPAVADILFGDYGPSGRLPISLPLASGQQPFFYSRKTSGRPPQSADQKYTAQHRDVPDQALYPFGHGLTYGDVVYDRVSLSSETLSWDGTLHVRASITNRGKRTADETVQLYIRDRVASMTRPRRELKGFRRITLRAGETAEALFTLTRNDLRFVSPQGVWVAEPGDFDLWVAPSATAGVQARFRLVQS